MARQAISKSVRFEVFKRDKFTCQYCGASAPEVLLEVDHIKPVSKGGTNDVMNLVTACRDCNRGKTNKVLDDDSSVKVQKQRLDDLQDRREQLKMMLEWREELMTQEETEIDAIESVFYHGTGRSLNDLGRNNIRKHIKRFGFNSVYEAMQIAVDQYYNGTGASCEKLLQKVGGICYNRKKASEGDAEQNP